MRKLDIIAVIIALNLFIFLNRPYCVADELSTNNTTGAHQKLIWPKIENKAFKAGELLNYYVEFGPIKVGKAKLHVKEIVNFNGRNAYHIIAYSESFPFFDIFYKVRNVDESLTDVESFASLKYEKHQRETNYIRDVVIVFDHINKKFYLTEKKGSKPEVKKEGEIPQFVTDVLSALYYVRTLQLKIGEEYFINSHSDEISYPIKVIVWRKEKIETVCGKFDCIVIEPIVLPSAGLFKAKGRLWIWLTDDDYKIPVLMKSKLIIGSIVAELQQLP